MHRIRLLYGPDVSDLSPCGVGPLEYFLDLSRLKKLTQGRITSLIPWDVELYQGYGQWGSDADHLRKYCK
jgi:hypothetical protein